ncbi:MAG: hypothetical protein K0R90_635 [Oscillospiraceae bacterium]|jgi:sugar phosphate isomerase/epimerase|nr:hypothetical protein [Oscillospiraceae bacterium]
MKFAVQLYSLRNCVDGNFPEVLKKVRKAGYDGVEFAGFYELKAQELKKILLDLGLESEGSHTGYSDLTERLDETIEYNQIIGTKNIIIPHYHYESLDDYKRVAEFCEKIGGKIHSAGMELLYHNHDFELKKQEDNQCGLEILKNHTQKENLSFELDIYWAQHVGLNPVEVMNQLGERCSIIHLKDMKDQETKQMTEVGTGIVDIKSVLDECVRRKFEWVAIEQDDIIIDPFDSIRISLEQARNLLSSLSKN